MIFCTAIGLSDGLLNRKEPLCHVKRSPPATEDGMTKTVPRLV